MGHGAKFCCQIAVIAGCAQRLHDLVPVNAALQQVDEPAGVEPVGAKEVLDMDFYDPASQNFNPVVWL